MADDLITIRRSELREIATVMVQEILREMKIKPRHISPWISKNQASKLSPTLGRKKLDAYIDLKLIEIKPPSQQTLDNPRATIYVRKSDVEKLIANPIL